MGTAVLASVLEAGATLVALVTDKQDSSHRELWDGGGYAGSISTGDGMGRGARQSTVQEARLSRKPVTLLWRCQRDSIGSKSGSGATVRGTHNSLAMATMAIWQPPSRMVQQQQKRLQWRVLQVVSFTTSTFSLSSSSLDAAVMVQSYR